MVPVSHLHEGLTRGCCTFGRFREAEAARPHLLLNRMARSAANAWAFFLLWKQSKRLAGPYLERSMDSFDPRLIAVRSAHFIGGQYRDAQPVLEVVRTVRCMPDCRSQPWWTRPSTMPGRRSTAVIGQPSTSGAGAGHASLGRSDRRGCRDSRTA